MKIHVDMNQLLQHASFISEQAQQYANTYEKIYQLLEQMNLVWKGNDFDAFANQLKDFRKDFNRMKQVLDDYAAYLRESASIYDRLQQECIAMANRLRY